MKGYFFLQDISGSVRKLDDRGGNDPFVQGDWFQLATSGTFYSPVYGKVTITPQDLATMLKNFKTITPLAPTQLPIDYDHLSDEPQLPGQARAAGWVEDLQLRDGGKELWCLPKWTRSAAKMIADGEYRFVSPYFLTDYKDKRTGKNVGPTLKAVAITNRPFLEGMEEIPAPAIAASDASIKQFGKMKRVAVPLRRAAHAIKSAQRSSISMADDKPGGEAKKPSAALKCPQCGAGVSNDGSHMKPPVTLDDEGAGDGDVDMDEGGKADDREGDPDYESKDVAKDKVGDDPMDPQLSDGADADDPLDTDVQDHGEEVGEEMKDKTKMSEKSDKTKMSPRERRMAEEINQLKTKSAETERALRDLQRGDRRRMSEEMIEKGLRSGQLTKKMVGTAEKPGWAMTESFNHPKRFRDWLRTAPRVVEFGERGTASETAADSAATTATKIEQLAGIAMSENKSLRYGDAVKKVLSENKPLADAYDREMIGERQPSSTRSAGIRRL